MCISFLERVFADISDYLSRAEIAYARKSSAIPIIAGWKDMDWEHATKDQNIGIHR